MVRFKGGSGMGCEVGFGDGIESERIWYLCALGLMVTMQYQHDKPTWYDDDSLCGTECAPLVLTSFVMKVSQFVSVSS